MEKQYPAVVSASVKYNTILIEGTEIFYREAGSPQKPNLVLLHGYPSSSHMFRNVIPALSEHFHIIAPDLPGFGFSEAPALEDFDYTFEHFSKIILSLLWELDIKKSSFYLFDYGAPIIMRLIALHPSLVEMLIFQNGTIHMEGLGTGLKDTMALFKSKRGEDLKRLEKLTLPDYIRWEYLTGVKEPSKIAPECYTLDMLLMANKGIRDIQLAIKENYSSNVVLYKYWQQILKELQPPTLIVWGENDKVFTKEGALALHNDLERSTLIFYPTGHFALEEFGNEITEEIISYRRSALGN